MQTIFLVLYSECLLVFLAAVQLYNFLIFRPLDMRYFSFANVSIPVKGVTHIFNLPKVCVKMMRSSRPTHPVPFTSKCQICGKSMFITWGILMKLFFLSHKCMYLPYRHIYHSWHINLPYTHVWNTVTSGLVPLVANWNC